MIVFNHNIVFENNIHLNHTAIDHTLPILYVRKVQTLPFLRDTSMNNQWIETSGQYVRYHLWEHSEKEHKPLLWALEVQNTLTLIWDARKRMISYVKYKDFTPKKLQFWIYHTFLPLVFELEKTYRMLHVGSVEIATMPVAFSALSFGGKSTLTDYFIQQGHTMLSDDTLGIEKKGSNYYAVASYPFHRPYREPGELGYSVKNFASAPKPLHAIYMLEKIEPHESVSITEIHGIDKFKAFHNSAFVFFESTKKDRFFFFSQMSKYIPVYKVSIPWELKRLPEVYTAIVNWTKNNSN